ncbi:MAG: hypothetical protein P8074_04080 [Anaerolineales bacterium]|jgi:hypothetical protein
MNVWLDLLLFFVLTTLLQWLVLYVIMRHCRLEDWDGNSRLRLKNNPPDEKSGFDLRRWLAFLRGQAFE